jgi:hypothetical protein
MMDSTTKRILSRRLMWRIPAIVLREHKLREFCGFTVADTNHGNAC